MTAILQQVIPKELDQWIKNDSNSLSIVDVRENEELAIASFPYEVIHLPLSQFSSWSENISQKIPCDIPIVVICHSGVRSMNFGMWLLDQELGYEVCNLEGGIDAWSVAVDDAVPRY